MLIFAMSLTCRTTIAFRLIVSELQRNSGVKEDNSKTKTDDVDAEMPETKENGTAAVVEDEVVNEQELKYWKAVKENPSDFTSWTYLLQFVEQEVCQRLPIWFTFCLHVVYKSYP